MLYPFAFVLAALLRALSLRDTHHLMDGSVADRRRLGSNDQRLTDHFNRLPCNANAAPASPAHPLALLKTVAAIATVSALAAVSALAVMPAAASMAAVHATNPAGWRFE